MRASARNLALGTKEACADTTILHQTSLAGGLGACYAPNGEREGRSRLAWQAVTSAKQRVREGRSRLTCKQSLARIIECQLTLT
jgi:hypothetical protein